MSDRDIGRFLIQRQSLLEDLYRAARPGSLDCDGFDTGRYAPELARVVKLTKAIDGLEKEFREQHRVAYIHGSTCSKEGEDVTECPECEPWCPVPT